MMFAIPCLCLFAGLLLVACGKNAPRQPPATSEVQAAPRTTEQAAEAGDINAQLAVANQLRTAPLGSKDRLKACDWYSRAAEAGSVAGMLESAHCYKNGVYVFDNDKLMSLWRRLAENGNAEAEYEYGMKGVFVGKSEYDRCRVLLFLDNSVDLAEEEDHFLTWVGKSADQKYPAAMETLGLVYLAGIVVVAKPGHIDLRPVDKGRGLSLLSESAELGLWRSQWKLAVLYQSGFGDLAPNKSEADHYWGLLDKQSSADALRALGDLYSSADQRGYEAYANETGGNTYKGHSLDFSETNELAAKWYRRAAALHDAQGLYALGTMYRDGRGVGPDAQTSIKYMREAAELGWTPAMRELAFAYAQGKGVITDYAEAFRWFQRAAIEAEIVKDTEVNRTRFALAAFYENGWGTQQDLVLSYAWYNIASAAGDDKARQALPRLERQLTAEQLAEAQALSKDWHAGLPMVRRQTASGTQSANNTAGTPSDGGASKGLSAVASGTAFSVSSDGHFLTNFHVIDGCTEVRVPAQKITLSVVVYDQINDLALLKTATKNAHPMPIAPVDSVNQGQDIFVFGYPLDGFLPASGNITPGVVSAMAGPANDSSLIQITAPVQPGNSGGPVINAKGQVVGVIVGKADAIKIAKATGDILQNVNFAIALQTVRAFLDGNRVPYKTGGSMFAFKKDAVAIADEARDNTVKVECWK